MQPTIRRYPIDWLESISAALAAELALGHALPEAVAGAKRYVHDAIASSYFVGPDCGVLGWARR